MDPCLVRDFMLPTEAFNAQKCEGRKSWAEINPELVRVLRHEKGQCFNFPTLCVPPTATGFEPLFLT
jgi:hypothetical protein